MVRRGIKNGLVGEIDAGVERFFALYADNVLRHGTPALPKKFFEQLGALRQALRGAHGDLSRGKPLSSVLSFYFRDEVLPYYAVTTSPRASSPPTTWVLGADAARLRAGLHGFRLRPQQGRHRPLRFKKNWGFEPQPLSYELPPVQARQRPAEQPMNLKYRAFIASGSACRSAWRTGSGRTSCATWGRAVQDSRPPLLYLTHRIPYPPNKGRQAAVVQHPASSPARTGCGWAASSIIRTTAATSRRCASGASRPA